MKYSMESVYVIALDCFLAAYLLTWSYLTQETLQTHNCVKDDKVTCWNAEMILVIVHKT